MVYVLYNQLHVLYTVRIIIDSQSYTYCGILFVTKDEKSHQVCCIRLILLIYCMTPKIAPFLLVVASIHHVSVELRD